MKILVAGGAGSIGSYLCESLLRRGDSVIVLDNLSTGRFENISKIRNYYPDKFTFIEHDVTERLPSNRLEKCDAVVDLASPASPDDFANLSLEILEVGSTGTRNLLDLATENKARFLLGSTSEVYGDPNEHPQKETYFGNVDPIGPRSCYDEAKRFSEALTFAYHRRHGTNTAVIRIFNTYSPRMRFNDGRVVTNFAVQAILNQPITLYGTGEQTRSFCYVTDLVTGLIKVLDSKITGPINIGNPDEKSVRFLAETIKNITNSKSEIITVKLPEERGGDPQRRCPDISKITKHFQWQPLVPLAVGLPFLIKSFEARLKG